MIRARFGKKTAAGRLLLGAGVLALLVPVIAGCEAGEDAPTLEFHPAAPGAQASAHGIKVSDAFVLGAPSGAIASGSSAGLFLSLYNGGTSPDKLLSVSSTGAASVAVTGTSVTLPAGSAVNLMGPQPQVVLTKLTAPITGGGYVPVVLDFANAGQVTISVPVEAQAEDFSTYSPPAAAAPATASPTPASTTSVTPTPVSVPKASASASATKKAKKK